MAKSEGSKSCSKVHLEELASEITTLIEHATPAAKTSSPTTCWSTNNEEMGVALTVLAAAGSSIHDGVTRFNLVYKSNPGEAASASMAKEMGGFCQQMVSSFTLLSSVGASKSMVIYLSAAVRTVLLSLKDLAHALMDPSRHPQVNSYTGVVWQVCKELQQAPKSNKLACRRQMMQWSVMMKDTIDEFQEAAKTAAAANADKSDAPADAQALSEELSGLSLGGDGAGGEDDFDFDGMDEEYSPSELQCVTASIDVLRAFRRCLKAANDALNTLDSAQPQGEDAAGVESKGGNWLEGRLKWAQEVQACLEEAHECAGDLAMQLYPPLDSSELSGRADDLGQKLASFCDVFYTRGEEGKVEAGQEQSPLRALVEDKLGVLRTGMAQL